MGNVALAIFGLTEKDMEETNNVYIYPDNWDSFMVFEFMSTQWRVVTGGVTGMDYNVIPLAIETLGIDKKDTPEIMQSIRVMETTASDVM